MKNESPLSKRELEALFWAANGRQPDEIALLMGISRKRVNNILYDVRAHLEAHTTPHAVAIAISRNYIRPTDIYDPVNPPDKPSWFKTVARFLSVAVIVSSANFTNVETFN